MDIKIDKDVVHRRIQEIRSFSEELRKLSQISKEDFLKNSERQHAIMHLLLLAIEGCIGLGNHIVSRKRLGLPESYKDTFVLLEKEGILPSDLARELMKMAQFRNRLVHTYWQMDLEKIYDIVTTRLGDFDAYTSIMIKLIQA